MTWLLLIAGREVARGTRAEVEFAAEERRVLDVLTCGAHTADPAYMPRLLSREAAIVPAASAPAMRRAS